MAKKFTTPLHVTTDHTGKMEGMGSISTSCAHNPCCLRNCKIKGSICEHCYAQTMMEMYDALDVQCENNTKLLSTGVLPDSDIPILENDYKIFRFEAFGDLHNETQLINYINIAKKNPNCRFTLWSKNYPVVLHYFSANPCPENFTMIISSMFINKRQDLTPYKATGAFAPGQLKVFTVFDKEFIKANWSTLNINCGSRWCMGCRLCYEKNSVEEINEILKSDKDNVEEFLIRKDPGYEDDCAAACDEIQNALDGLENL